MRSCSALERYDDGESAGNTRALVYIYIYVYMNTHILDHSLHDIFKWMSVIWCENWGLLVKRSNHLI